MMQVCKITAILPSAMTSNFPKRLKTQKTNTEIKQQQKKKGGGGRRLDHKQVWDLGTYPGKLI